MYYCVIVSPQDIHVMMHSYTSTLCKPTDITYKYTSDCNLHINN